MVETPHLLPFAAPTPAIYDDIIHARTREQVACQLDDFSSQNFFNYLLHTS